MSRENLRWCNGSAANGNTHIQPLDVVNKMTTERTCPQNQFSDYVGRLQTYCKFRVMTTVFIDWNAFLVLVYPQGSRWSSWLSFCRCRCCCCCVCMHFSQMFIQFNVTIDVQSIVNSYDIQTYFKSGPMVVWPRDGSAACNPQQHIFFLLASVIRSHNENHFEQKNNYFAQRLYFNFHLCLLRLFNQTFVDLYSFCVVCI